MKKFSIFLLIFSIILTSVTPAHSWPWSRNRRLPKTATIQGRVTNSATNRAISRVAVRAGRYRVTTNASGKYVIKNAKVWYWGRIYRVRVSAKGYYSRSRWIYVRRGRTRTLNFRLKPRITTATIKGRIIDRDTRKGIAGAKVEARCWWRRYRNKWRYSVYTDVNGYYKIKNVRTLRWWSLYRISVSKKGYGSRRRYLYVRPGRMYRRNFTLLALHPPSDVSPPVINNLIPTDNSIINSSYPEISAIVKDTESGVDPSSIIMKVDGNIVTHSYDKATGKLTYTPITSLADGTHTIYIEVKDKAGNKASAQVSFTVDTTAPELAIISHKDGDIVIGNE